MKGLKARNAWNFVGVGAECWFEGGSATKSFPFGRTEQPRVLESGMIFFVCFEQSIPLAKKWTSCAQLEHFLSVSHFVS